MSSRRNPERGARNAGPPSDRRVPSRRSHAPGEARVGGKAPADGYGWHPGRFAASVEALSSVMAFSSPADATLSSYFRNHRQLGMRDRAAVSDIVYEILRHRRWLERICQPASARNLLLAALVKLRGLSIAAIANIAQPEEMEWLVGVRASSADDLSPAERLDLPDWVYERLQLEFAPEALESLGRALQSPASLDLRVNTMKMSRPQALEALESAGIAAQATPYSPVGIRLSGKPAINLLPIFKEGAIEVQDEGSQLIALLLAPRRQDLVVDFCAGAGGKTLALGAAMDSRGRLYAFDVSDARLSKFKPRLKRSGLSNVFPQRITGVRDAHVKRLAGKADRVLLDVPCSGLGTVRRNPDLKWRTQASDITEMVAKQSEILQYASALVKPGGRLVYATCSLLREENEAVVEQFLHADSPFRLVNAAEVLAQSRIDLNTGPYLKLRPDTHDTDGFFAAVLQRDDA